MAHGQDQMARRFIIRHVANGRARLNESAFAKRGTDLPSLILELPDGVMASVFNNYLSHDEILIPNGFIIQIAVSAPDINKAIDVSRGIADYVLSLISSVSVAAIDQPLPVWAYDASEKVTERDYVIFVYDPWLAMRKRAVNQDDLLTFLNRIFNILLANQNIKDDFKKRIFAAFQSFRRAISDNDDPLTEFLIYWTSLESTDWVYRKMFPARRSRKGDGIKRMLSLLGNEDKFEELKEVRNGISHGYRSLNDCLSSANANMGLVRQATLKMIMTIIGVGDETQHRVLATEGFKGKPKPHVRWLFTGTFDPVDVGEFDGHPGCDVKFAGINILTEGKELKPQPTYTFTARNCKTMTMRGYEAYGEFKGQFTVENVDVK